MKMNYLAGRLRLSMANSASSLCVLSSLDVVGPRLDSRFPIDIRQRRNSFWALKRGAPQVPKQVNWSFCHW